MKLYIQVENGQPVNHPALKDNLIQAFQKVPDNWEPFLRIPRPELGVYEVFQSETPTYQLVEGLWQDVWSVREMTEEEKAIKQSLVKEEWNRRPNRENFAAWVFDEATCSFVAPVQKPADGKEYFWDGSKNAWVQIINT